MTNEPNATLLAQRLVGDGVTISNVIFTGNLLMAGYFRNINLTRPALDSGILLTCGRAKTSGSNTGMDGNGSTLASAILANNSW